MIIENYGYNESLKKEDIKFIIENSYLEINYNDEESEIIKLTFYRDYMNDNFIWTNNQLYGIKQESSINIEENMIDKTELINKIKSNGVESNGTYSYQIGDSPERQILYFETINKILFIENEIIKWSYHIDVEEYNCEIEKDEEEKEDFNSKNCKKIILQDIEKYIIQGSN